MKLLLDTHVFLWFISADAQLPPVWRDRIRDQLREDWETVKISLVCCRLYDILAFWELGASTTGTLDTYTDNGF